MDLLSFFGYVLLGVVGVYVVARVVSAAFYKSKLDFETRKENYNHGTQSTNKQG